MPIIYEDLSLEYGKLLKDRPIVVIDSGVGGLAFTKKLADAKPVENIIYFADTEFMPLGNKNEKLIGRRIVKIIAKIKKLEPKAVIFACNTLDALAGDKVQGQLGNIPFYRIIDVTAKQAISSSKSKEIGLLATTNTIESHRYIYSMLSTNPHTHLIGVECPNLAYAIETGVDLKKICNEEIEPLKEFNIDTLILGCTHYSTVIPMIKKVYPHVNLVDSSAVLLETFIDDLESKLQFNVANKPTLKIITTKVDTTFETNVNKYLSGIEYDILVEDELK